MRAKTFKWLLWLGASTLLICVALLIITPPLLNSDFVRTKIQTLVAEEVGAEIKFQNIEVVFTPQPTLQIEQIKFDLPDIINIQAVRIALSPNLVKLISGGGLVDTLQLEKPVVRLDLPHNLAPSSDPITEAELWVILSRIINPLITYTPDLKIVLTDGSFDLADKTGSPFFVRGIDAVLALNAEQEALNIELNGQFTNLTFKINDTPTQLNIQNLSASTLLHPDQIILKLNNLSLMREELDFDGDLTVTRTDPKFKLRLASQVPDLIKIFPFLRPLLAGVEGSSQVFDSILGGSLENISMQSEADDIMGLFDLKAMRIDARLEEGEFFLSRLSHKVNNVSGRLRIADRRIELTDSQLEAGQTYANIEKIAVYRKNASAPFTLEIDNTRIHFNLAALHKNLYGIPAIKAQLDEIASMSGQLNVNMIHLKGPLAELADWKFKANGSIAETVIATPRFPAPISVLNGTYSADERSINFKEIHLRSLEADLLLSGTVRGAIPTPTSIEASVSGEIDENLNRWFRETAGLVDTYALNTPISIKRASLYWKSGTIVTAKGNFKPSGGPTISGDMSFTPEENLHVELSLTDRLSQANISFQNKKDHLDVSFSGNLQKETINNIFAKEQLSSGRIEGDFSLELARNNGIQITTSGELQGENLLLPIDTKEPVVLSTFAVTGHDQTLGVEHLALWFGEERADINGTISGVDGKYHLDLDVHTGPLDLLKMLDQYKDLRGERSGTEPDAGQGSPADKDPHPRDLPFSGRINLDVEALNLAHLSIKPLRTDIRFTSEKISAQAVEASLCGIDLLASVQYSPGIIELSLPINAIEQDLSAGSICLTGERSKVSGTYDLTGKFSTRGAADELIQSAQGELLFLARNGAIEESPLVSRLLSVVNLTEFYKTDYQTLDKSMLGYKTLQIDGQLAQGRMTLPKIHFDGSTLEIIGQGHADLDPADVNVELLIAPLKTVDSLIKWIPGVNYLLAGNLITIPVRITGPFSTLKIKVIPAGSVGKSLLGITERILKLPVKIIEPLTGEGKAKNGETAEAP